MYYFSYSKLYQLALHYVSQGGEAVHTPIPFTLLDQLFTGKIRIRLLTKLLLNPAGKVYLRGLERELDVSSNTVRLELAKLSEMHLIQADNSDTQTKVKHYSVNTRHPLYSSLRSIILQHVGLDQILEKVVKKLGDLRKVYLTGGLLFHRIVCTSITIHAPWLPGPSCEACFATCSNASIVYCLFPSPC